MKHCELTIITLLLAFSFNGMAQNKEMNLELNPTVSQAAPVKIEQINNQDILRVTDYADTIRIPLSEATRSQLENLMQSAAGTRLILKDIDGADVNLLRVTMNMRPGIFFKREMTKTVSIFNDDIKELLADK